MPVPVQDFDTATEPTGKPIVRKSLIQVKPLVDLTDPDTVSPKQSKSLPAVFRIAGDGLAKSDESGRRLRVAMRAMLDELDDKIAEPVRAECARLVGQTLTSAYEGASPNRSAKS